MVSTTRERGRPKKLREEKNDAENEEIVAENNGGDANIVEYEESRAQRIKQNAERMKSLGIFDLSKNLKAPSSKPRKVKSAPPRSNDPPRRSFRLKELPTVSYLEKKSRNYTTVVKKVKIHIEKGKNPEIYTEEHEKLLGDSKEDWDLYVDGFDEDGQRIYDPVAGKSCHQCRQKTMGLHTECSKCKLVPGKFCGDCLYMRYGENVKEVNENPDWVCPVCRGICNCSRCRRDKGLMPTGAIYNRVVKLGFKSVAHYLIHTFRGQTIKGDDPVSAIGSLPIDDREENDDMKQDSDEDYRGGDDHEEDDHSNDTSSSENDSQ